MHPSLDVFPGVEASAVVSNPKGAPDLQRALSLLSVGACGLPDPVHQTSCIIQFTGASENSSDLHLSHGGNSGPASCADGQHIATQPQSQLVRFNMDTSNNVYEPSFFGVNQIN